jgi:hypothetical protein
VGWRSQAVDGPDEPECTGEDGPSLHKGDRSGQIISSWGDRSGQATSSIERQIMSGHLFIRETGQRQAISS